MKILKKLKKTLGYRLPESYKVLMRIQNGGELRKNNFEDLLKEIGLVEVLILNIYLV